MADEHVYSALTQASMEAFRLREVLKQVSWEGRNLLPDATDDQAAVIEAWAKKVLADG